MPGHLITDNVLLVYELTHYLKSKGNGTEGAVAINLDMSKVYDRDEWGFLHSMMIKMSFKRQWGDLVMRCVSTMNYRIKVNGDHTEEITPQRRLHQGDPLSPYLFIICAEGLSAMLQWAERDRKIVGIKVCHVAPSVNHLFFADDSLILLRARNGEAKELKRVLEVYERVLGQMINKFKSSVLFSPNTVSTARDQMKAILSVAQEKWGQRYLGLPVSIEKSKKKTFTYIKQKIWSRVQGWQEKMLSKAGKEILVKAVAKAIPTYAMSCFDKTKCLCAEISVMVSRNWWSQQDKKHKIHWFSWEKLTRSKKKGGLGFRDLHLFNLAMLVRQAWRLLTNPNSLCGRVLKAKYFPNNNILECQVKGGISYSWRSILQGVELMKKGIIWRVGDGSNIKIWTDPWIP